MRRDEERWGEMERWGEGSGMVGLRAAHQTGTGPMACLSDQAGMGEMRNDGTPCGMLWFDPWIMVCHGQASVSVLFWLGGHAEY